MALAMASIATAPPAAATTPNPLTALVDAAAARLLTADPVAAFKWRSGGSIDDPARVDQVLAAVTDDAVAQGVDPDFVDRIFSDQIDATEAIEYTRFAQWKFDPSQAPATAPDLAASRSQIDDLNRTMVDEIAGQWTVLHSPGCAADRDDAVRRVEAARHLDRLYRQALGAATRSYCAAN